MLWLNTFEDAFLCRPYVLMVIVLVIVYLAYCHYNKLNVFIKWIANERSEKKKNTINVLGITNRRSLVPPPHPLEPLVSLRSFFLVYCQLHNHKVSQVYCLTLHNVQICTYFLQDYKIDNALHCLYFMCLSPLMWTYPNVSMALTVTKKNPDVLCKNMMSVLYTDSEVESSFSIEPWWRVCKLLAREINTTGLKHKCIHIYIFFGFCKN